VIGCARDGPPGMVIVTPLGLAAIVRGHAAVPPCGYSSSAITVVRPSSGRRSPSWTAGPPCDPSGEADEPDRFCFVVASLGPMADHYGDGSRGRDHGVENRTVPLVSCLRVKFQRGRLGVRHVRSRSPRRELGPIQPALLIGGVVRVLPR